MASKVEICNLALLRLGEREISAVDEDSKPAQYLRAFYEPVRKAMLTAYPWNFATTVDELAALDVDDEEWDYVYQMPSDCLRALRLVNGEANDDDYEVRADRLYCDLEDAFLRYIVDNDDESEFPPGFVDAFAYRLAAELAMPVTGNVQLAQAMMQQAQNAVMAARSADAQEHREGAPAVGREFIDARTG